jgi:hypothetical protein
LSPFFVIGIPTGLGGSAVCPFPFFELSGGNDSADTSSDAELTLLFFLMPQVDIPFPEAA